MDIEKLLTTKNFNLLKYYKINDTFLLGIYQGKISTYDILLKFRQKFINGNWSRLRTPKHIHWTVDLLIKMSHYPELSRDFLQYLQSLWENTIPNKTENERDIAITIESFLESNTNEIEKYSILNSKGEYSIKFLLTIAKLLMQQEKNNLEKAYMFKNLLNSSYIFTVKYYVYK